MELTKEDYAKEYDSYKDQKNLIQTEGVNLLISISKTLDFEVTASDIYMGYIIRVTWNNTHPFIDEPKTMKYLGTSRGVIRVFKTLDAVYNVVVGEFLTEFKVCDNLSFIDSGQH